MHGRGRHARTIDTTATALRDDVQPEAKSEDFADNAMTMIRHDGKTQPVS
jgi:hypothetical protein